MPPQAARPLAGRRPARRSTWRGSTPFTECDAPRGRLGGTPSRTGGTPALPVVRRANWLLAPHWSAPRAAARASPLCPARPRLRAALCRSERRQRGQRVSANRWLHSQDQFHHSAQQPGGVALSGSSLYVASFDTGVVGKYVATSGAAINTNFITGLNGPRRPRDCGQRALRDELRERHSGQIQRDHRRGDRRRIHHGLEPAVGSRRVGQQPLRGQSEHRDHWFLRRHHRRGLYRHFCHRPQPPDALAVSNNSLFVATERQHRGPIRREPRYDDQRQFHHRAEWPPRPRDCAQ